VYVVVYCGYEGLERIFWVGVDRGQAVQVTRWIRDRIWWGQQVDRIVVGPEPSLGGQIWEDWAEKKYLTWKRLGGDLQYLHDPSRVCIQVEREPLDYGCVCEELGVEIEGEDDECV